MIEPLEIWAGVECTRNRVGDRFFDQLRATGHDQRPGDLQLIAELGAKALRYPVLWERIEESGSPDWCWTDERLRILRDLRIRPIVGFVHHGSGPPDTNLLDPHFAPRLADFAARVAERYPWVRDFTPVNEPLTTARFSGLYGHWYPHAHNDAAFVRALLNQCRAIVLSMQALRSIIPDARLVQTEDMGQTSSTPRLRYQADFENERRWLSFDLLSGCVDRKHALWEYLIRMGQASESELAWFLENPCPPDVVGLNYYLTSERFLHDKTENFPPGAIGGNGRDRYADVETARVREEGLVGAESILLQAWDRYRRPLAITECHNGCTREEQLRWVLEVWRGCHSARAKGADVRALTAWSVFGAVDWDSLVTAPRNHYEPGVYDIRSPHPRPTALVSLIRGLARQEEPSHPLTDVPGWWHRPERLLHGVVEKDEHLPIPIRRSTKTSPRPLVVLGATDALGRRLLHDCNVRGIPAMSVDAREDANTLISEIRPWAILDCSAGPNFKASEHLAELCAERRIRLVTFSNAAVFDGSKAGAYPESDPVSPETFLGHQSVRREAFVAAHLPSALILRTGPLFSMETADFLGSALRGLRSRRGIEVDAARVMSPTFIPDVAHAALDLLIDGDEGIFHVSNVGAETEFEFVRKAAALLGISTEALLPTKTARDTQNFALQSERAWIMPTLDSALERYCDQSANSFLLEEAA